MERRRRRFGEVVHNEAKKATMKEEGSTRRTRLRLGETKEGRPLQRMESHA